LDAGQITALKNGDSNDIGEDRLEYLRGKTNQADLPSGRTRNAILADFVNADPFFMGAPAQRYVDLPGEGTGSNTYSNFVATYADRTNVVFIGGNGGMVHGIIAETGEELFAYVPVANIANANGSFNRLHALTTAPYLHQYYADGSPTIGDAFLGTDSEWHTVLVAGLNLGGQGIYALDVTDPDPTKSEAQMASMVMWEFTDADDPDLGYTFSQPSIVRVRVGSATKWAAIIGNGYNNSEADGSASADGKGALFIILLDGPGNDGIWDLGTEYFKIKTTVGSVATPQGLATPAPVDADGDGIVDFVFTGDLAGNMWKYDLTVAAASIAAPTKLYTAMDTQATPQAQPITARPEVGLHLRNGVSSSCTVGSPGDCEFLVYFGTGKYIETDDNSFPAVNPPVYTFYAIWDKNEGDTVATALRDDSILLKQEVGAEFTLTSADENGNGTACSLDDTEDCPEVRGTTQNAVDWDNQLGWFIDLPTGGERSTTTAILRNKRIIFTTLIPDSAACEFGGDSWLMELDAETGGALTTSPFDFSGDDEFGYPDNIAYTYDSVDYIAGAGGRKSVVGITSEPTILADDGKEFKYTSGSKGGIETIKEDPGPQSHGRETWRQIK